MSTSATEVLEVLDALAAADIEVWLDGGWGIDALLGTQHREHDDVDLVVRLSDVAGVLEALTPLGYRLAEDLRPTRAVLRAADGRQVDLHPVTYDADGTGWQAGAAPDGGDAQYPADGFTTGEVAGGPAPCLSPALQTAHHAGYDRRPRDEEDLSRLRARWPGLRTDG